MNYGFDGVALGVVRGLTMRIADGIALIRVVNDRLAVNGDELVILKRWIARLTLLHFGRHEELIVE